MKAIAKATGVTQKSLLDAAKGGSSSAKTSSSSKKTNSVKLTSAEKTMLDAYRKADADTQKAALKLLKGEKGLASDLLGNILNNAIDMLGNLNK